MLQVKKYIMAALRMQGRPQAWVYSKQYSTTELILNPWFVTGFIDGEGCLGIKIIKKSSYRLGWSVLPIFVIGLHRKDIAILEQIQTYFGVGKIYSLGSNAVQYNISSIKDFKVLIDHLDKYPLITAKLADYLLWRQIVMMVLEKEHLTANGLQAIVNLRASLNLGLSDGLKTAFPETIPIVRSLISKQEIPHPEWVAGFTSGEGCFLSLISKASTRIGFQVRLIFQLTQHSRDSQLMKSMIDYFGCGVVYSRGEAVDYRVQNLSGINNKIIPFFKNSPILGEKTKDFQGFSKISEIITEKGHLTLEGLDRIRDIKASMKGRK